MYQGLISGLSKPPLTITLVGMGVSEEGEVEEVAAVVEAAVLVEVTTIVGVEVLERERTAPPVTVALGRYQVSPGFSLQF